MRRRSDPRLLPLLAIVAVLLVTYLLLEQRGQAAIPQPAADSLLPGPEPAVRYVRRPRDYLSPGNLTQCQGDETETARNLLRVTFASATSAREHERIAKHLQADLMPRVLAVPTQDFVLALPGAVSCPDRSAALAWLLRQSMVVAASPYSIERRR